MSSWVLLRGWAREARHWGDFPAQFGTAIPGAQLVALDLPGSGRFWAQRSPWSIAAMVEESRQALRAQGAQPPYHLLGLSLGAMVSVEWASRHSAEVAACVLLNTSLRPFSAFHERLRPRHYATLLRIALLEGDAREREATILRMTSAASAPRTDVIAAWARFAKEQPVSRGNVLRQLVAAALYRAPDARPPVPILVLASRGDRLVDAACSVNLARRWNAPIALHPTAGHDLTFDEGPWVASQVQQWLRRI
jgi:pimeloyl-ACP methyl ester carboxylesterase